MEMADTTTSTSHTSDVSRYAEMFAAMGAEPRLRIMRLLLSAHPDGLVVGELQAELEIAGSTLSHHLEKLKTEDLVTVAREGTFLRYRANTNALRDLLGFLYTECCSRTGVRPPDQIVHLSRSRR
jgi:DNA-binding transcriptional ArsR family regulator